LFRSFSSASIDSVGSCWLRGPFRNDPGHLDSLLSELSLPLWRSNAALIVDARHRRLVSRFSGQPLNNGTIPFPLPPAGMVTLPWIFFTAWQIESQMQSLPLELGFITVKSFSPVGEDLFGGGGS